ncbi:MAG TPA: RNase adapter RapZ [Firmicutes bacterium]|nr:RNase adapter RapZ [Bacillota bacterium]
MEGLRFVIITGLSGAGKTEAIRSFEDLGYFCVDNLPPALLPKFVELCAQSGGRIRKVALVIDIRGGKFFDTVAEALDRLGEMGFTYDILFLEASDEALIRRFKETRRRHPLAVTGSLQEGITAERARLETLRSRATKIIDTTHLSPHELKTQITQAFATDQDLTGLSIRVLSFGYRFGLPLDADLVFDVRFLPNPHWVEELRPHTGLEPEVRDYVLGSPLSREYLERLQSLLSFMLPGFVKEGKTQLVVAFGCTGGRHRSVAMAEAAAAFLRDQGYRVQVEHRDVAK